MSVRDDRPRLTLLALGIASILALPAARAQDAGPSTPAGPSYHDRIIASQQLRDLPPDEDEEDDSGGAPRSYHAEAIVSRNERGDDAYDEQGISVGGLWETPSWGSLSLDATFFHTTRDRFDGIGTGAGDIGGAATLWQRDLYVDGGWRVNNGLGVLNTPLPELQRNQYRFFLPTVAFAGASSEWLHDAGGVSLQGAFGRAGLYTGTRVTGFDMADGNVSALGAQWAWSSNWTGAASFLGTQGRIIPDGYGEPVFAQGDTRALYAATAWQDARDRLQFNVLGSDGDLGHATGGWIDASAHRGRYLHNAGAFYLQPGLSWGALPINNDVQGGYYRIAYDYARWSWNLGLDSIGSLSGDNFDGQYATSYLRYQASSYPGLRRQPQPASVRPEQLWRAGICGQEHALGRDAPAVGPGHRGRRFGQLAGQPGPGLPAAGGHAPVGVACLRIAPLQRFRRRRRDHHRRTVRRPQPDRSRWRSMAPRAGRMAAAMARSVAPTSTSASTGTSAPTGR